MTTKHNWTKMDIPNLEDKVAIVTGANSGLGYEVALGLAQVGARVVMACRSMDKAKVAAGQIRAQHPSASLDLMPLDLADLASVRHFADDFQHTYRSLHILVNNAGIMAIPRRETADGFEMQLGINHLGHFALTGRLLPALVGAPGARVVNVSSNLHKSGVINFNDLMGKVVYDKWAAYSQSKLANLLFTYELQRKFDAAGVDVMSVGAHPGYTATNLQAVGPTMEGSPLMRAGMALANLLVAQRVEMGALPILYAATEVDVTGCDYIGPTGFQGMRGYPGKLDSSARSHDQAVAARLWAISEELTAISYAETLATGKVGQAAGTER